MKVNLPITHEEIAFPTGRYLVSKTDQRGVITHANAAFIELSGFSREELIGQSHNLVRHPDMPPEAFQDLWQTLQAGLPWHGLVKNRCKNGDYYWVKAFVVPIRKDGRVTGYMSVRTEPGRDEVRDAHALYARIREKQAGFPRVMPGFTGRYRFGTRLKAVMGVMLLLTASNGLLAVFGAASPQRDLLLAGIAGLATALAVAITLYFSRRIDGPLGHIAQFFNQIAEGNLTNDVDVRRRDETGLLFCQLGEMQVHLLAMLDDIAAAASSIESESLNLKVRMMQVDAQSSDQSDRVKTAAAATEELTVSVREVASHATETAEAARQTRDLLAESSTQIGQTKAISEQVVATVARSEQTIAALSQAIGQISNVTNVISEVAAQTNLLALNAAIEAARAGEQGRGFAVVADEVRTLAERTASSTADITQTVGEIQRVAALSISEMATAKREVEASLRALQHSVELLSTVSDASDGVASQASAISDATAEQAHASDDVARNMEHISQLIDANLQSSTAASVAADQLNDTARRMRALINGFTLHRA